MHAKICEDEPIYSVQIPTNFREIWITIEFVILKLMLYDNNKKSILEQQRYSMMYQFFCWKNQCVIEYCGHVATMWNLFFELD